MATVLSARKTRNVRNAARFPRSIPIVTYLYVHVSRFRVFFFVYFFLRVWQGLGLGKASHIWGEVMGEITQTGKKHTHKRRKETREKQKEKSYFLELSGPNPIMFKYV